MLKHVETLEARLASIDVKLASIAQFCALLVDRGLVDRFLEWLPDETPSGTGVPPASVAEKAIYRSTAYTTARVGISPSTLFRCQQRGEIAVALKDKKKNYYLDSDVERLRESYWDR